MAAANVGDSRDGPTREREGEVESSIRAWFSRIQDTISLAVSSTTRTGIDRKLFERTIRLIEKVMKLCQNPRLNLKNSPPCMLDILPELIELLKLILKKYDDKINVLNENEYFKVFMDNIDRKLKQVTKLFKDVGEKIFNENAPSRRKLTKYSLIFSHMLADLKAIFPNGHYIGRNFKITKADAQEFWNKSFGSK